jgi:hypothetical protein
MGAIAHLKRRGLCSAGVIRAYHSRRVAPLMAHVIPLFGKASSVWSEGTVLTQDLLRDFEIEQRIR